jgi:cytochrome c-type biogenesis protein CcmF
LRVYETAGLVLPETALRSTLGGDLQIAVRRVDQRGDVTIDVHIRPLAWLVWLGALLIVAGGVAAFGSRPRSQVPPGANDEEPTVHELAIARDVA